MHEQKSLLENDQGNSKVAKNPEETLVDNGNCETTMGNEHPEVGIEEKFFQGNVEISQNDAS